MTLLDSDCTTTSTHRMPSEGKVYYYLPHTASRAQLRVRLREAVEGALVLEGVTVAPLHA